MQTDALPPVEAIVRNPLVGVDERQRRHRFDRYRDVVFVLDPDEQTVEHVERLQPGQLPEWVDHVDDECGWADCRHVDERDPFGALAGQLAADLEGQR